MNTEQRKYRHCLLRKLVAAIVVTTFLMSSVLLSVSYLARRFPFNQSTSMPIGFYRLVSKRPERGSIVGACIPDEFAALAKARRYLPAGTCPTGIRPVMKYLAATPGDLVEINWDGVTINGQKVPNTGMLQSDALGRFLPNHLGRHVVKQGEYWIFSNHDSGSFDSRYFGPVRDILGVVVPLLTEEELERIPIINNLIRFGKTQS